jgi:hypothetical protein
MYGFNNKIRVEVYLKLVGGILFNKDRFRPLTIFSYLIFLFINHALVYREVIT